MIGIYATLVMFIIFGTIGYLMYREIKYIDRENVSGFAFNQIKTAKQMEEVAKNVGESLEELRKIHADMVQRQEEVKVKTKEQNSH